MITIGLNTALDPSEIERPPLNLALAIDTSGSMAGEPIARVREGLERMLAALSPEDHISLVAFSDSAQVVAEGDNGDFRVFQGAIDGLKARGATNLYDGLRSAYELVERGFDRERQNRVILLSDGVATAGVVESPRIAELGRAYAERGIGLSTIGLGDEFDAALLRTLAEAGAGTFHFVENPAAVREVFTEEVDLTIVPIAERGLIDLNVGEGYKLSAIYGTRLSSMRFDGASIELPTLHIANRQNAEDNETGRRGGGGVIIAELVPLEDESPKDVGSLEFAYDDPRTGERVEQEVAITSPAIDGDTLERGYFGGEGVEKSFVALNIYAGFELAAQASQAGDYGTALVALEALRDNVDEWLKKNSDPDIEDDQVYVDKLIELLGREATLARPMSPPNPWPRD
jgi:Ca-activated chloride channel family protein